MDFWELPLQLDDLRHERNGLAEDLEDCQLLCDSNMKGQQDELVKKRQQLAELHKKVMECRCKLPVDASVTAKRTPSLAALCRCTPEDQFEDSCSCTSLRSQLLSNLLADLFGGLQSELGDTGAQMPCQLLKCLEDKHNWDRTTPVKTNLRDYFSKLLLGELDIAIATSIEKYHATVNIFLAQQHDDLPNNSTKEWVGASCADKPLKADMPCESMHSEDWQSRALECKAQKMATKLAEQLFKEKAKELAQQAQDVLAKQGKPPCECHPSSCCTSPPRIQHTQCDCASGRGCAPRGAAVYQCLVKPPLIGGKDTTNNELTPPKYLRRTLEDVSQLRVQIEDLKKNIIKREDLTTMEANIVKMVQFASVISPAPSLLEIREPTGIMKKDPNCPRPFKTDGLTKNSGVTKLTNRKKSLEPATNTNKPFKQAFNQFRTKASGKDFKRPTQQFAVNMCLCDAKTKVSTQSKVFSQPKSGSGSTCKQSVSRDNESNLSNKSQAQNIKAVTPEISFYDKASTLSSCTEKCICFHKKPSDISINKLLETLTKWRDDLVDIPEKQNIDKRPENQKSIFQISQQIVSNIQEKPRIKILDGKSIENLELFKVSSPNVKALCDSETLTDTIEQVKTSAKSKIEVELPALTDSEYMGAINLEKSTEHSCECEKNQNDGPMCYKNADKFPFKCINSKKCMCKSCISTPIYLKQEIDTQTVMTQNSLPIESRTMHDFNVNLDSATLTKNNQNRDVDDVAVSVKTSLKSVKCSALFQDNIENCIKCLGVTLSNVTSQSSLQNLNIEQSMHKINLPESGNIGISYSAFQGSNAHNKNNEHFLVKTNCLHVDKFIEVQNFKNDVQSDEPCICCPTFDVNGSTDLEVNAFQLLEEYLRGKLDDFKHSVCKSSCIPRCDAEKLFTDILQRVKQLIFDTTNTVTCECEGNSQVKGSWKRAYSLLYEYLRTKIERVKCQCQSKSETKDDVVLPNVLNDISYLIENDFKRLQEICKCKKNKPSNKTKLNTNEKTKDALDIVIDDCNMKEVPKIIELNCTPTTDIYSNGESPQKDIIEPENLSSLIHSVSAQVSPYHSMETKSCNAMEKNNMYTEVQTMEENIKIVTIDGFNNTKSVSDCCDKTKNVSKGSHPNFVELIENNDNSLDELKILQKETDLFPTRKPLCVSNKESAIQMEIERIFGDQQEMNRVNKKARNASLSYIGYTMNCCCDTALGCVCTKSTVRAQNDRLKIKDIWKTYMKNNTISHNVSYMLDNTPDKLSKTVNYVEIREGFYPKLAYEYESIHRAKSNVCQSEINTNSEKDIILKESKESVSMSHVTTNTTGRKRKPKSDTSLDCSDYFTTPSRRKSERFSVIKQNKKCELFYPKESFIQFDDSDTALIDNTANTSDSSTVNCDCKMVPICHVKMLVENIEDKLANAQCTCDSLSSKVCPVHSQREIY
ncbi:hypothetical protein MSG28_000364 [Choristoneura fumiferana]|uniref:Uncharacterized protein n=1 Tax=Choristoneura fumiferana TaxID=7141 RepID=A0ACC0K0A2_CHOFU|nr:hypothetical protein MSG28_000364 [Choristoneura fumiferana]